MNILYLTNDISVLGGIERVLKQKANYFSENYNYNIDILSQTNKEKNNFFVLNDKIQLYCLNLKLNTNFIQRQMFRLKYFYFLKKLIEKNEYDIIISTGFFMEPYLKLLKVKKRIYIVKEFHNSILKTPFYKNRIKRFFWKKIYSKYDKLIILTEEDRNTLKLLNIKVIPNPLPFYPEEFSKCENKKIISVGRLDEQKGYDILIDVWNMISKKYPDWILEIYGEGPERENLQDKINKLGLEKSFLLKGAVKNIQDKYLESSIYVMSSRYEGFGMVLVEAMACGLPVVSFDCPCGPKDIIKNNEDGFIVKFGNIEQMAEKIEELILDEEKRKLFGKNARKNIQRYSQDKIMNQWKELFEELVRNK